MLIETISFTTTPDEMLDSLTLIIADRWVGAAFFGNYYTMDFELMGGDFTSGDYRRGCQAQDHPNAAPAGAIWSAPVADVDHPGTGRKDTGRSSLRPKARVVALAFLR
jgi:hypothetical protein